MAQLTISLLVVQMSDGYTRTSDLIRERLNTEIEPRSLP